jgi:hypothetical protein
MTKVLTLADDGSFQEVDISTSDTDTIHFDGGAAIQPAGVINIDFGNAGTT